MFFSLDIQATRSLDRRMENSRQGMFIAAFERIFRNLRNKRDISEDQVKMVSATIHMYFILFLLKDVLISL